LFTFVKKLNSMSDFHSLKISEIKQETPTSVAVTFEVPTALKGSFSFVAGQYITLKHTINGTEVRRAYSICSAPSSGMLTVGIKKVEGGVFSVYANDQLTVGERIEVMVPEGTFTLTPNPRNTKHIAAFAAGSGITPILSIAQTAMQEETDSTFLLVYGNQTKEEAMFHNTIEQLKRQFPERFFIEYIYSRAQETNAARGRIDKSVVTYYLKNKYKETAFENFYLCGPEAMIHEVSNTLVASGVPKKHIYFELFTTSKAAVPGTAQDGNTQISIIVDEVKETFTMPQNKTILEAALEKQLDAPYSCQGGICSSCIGRVIEGKAEMRQNQILTDSEVAEGLVLTCQAHPVTPTLVLDYDDI
jgi:ring-1,2-phenylacetyl-CoA epoxidase subunit PaaE